MCKNIYRVSCDIDTLRGSTLRIISKLQQITDNIKLNALLSGRQQKKKYQCKTFLLYGSLCLSPHSTHSMSQQLTVLYCIGNKNHENDVTK